MAIPPDLTIIVPTFNERENIAPLIDKLSNALAGIHWSVLFVDDNSPDGTADTVNEIADRDPRVSCLKRIGRRGLSSACIEGMEQSTAPYLAVMDADLQHNETILPKMLEELQREGTELVVASRYTDGGGMRDWSMHRRVISRAATWLSKAFIPNGTTDPMSGFFMLRRTLFDEVAPRLSGQGFKILLDIFLSARCPVSFTEVPFTFRPRQAGESKLDVQVVWELVEMLAEKSIGRIIPVRFILFAAVGGVGVGVHLSILGIAYELMGATFQVAQASAIFIAMTSNFFLNNIITFRAEKLHGTAIIRGLLAFYAACTLGAVVNYAVADWTFELTEKWVVAGTVGAIAGAVWNYATTSVFTWRVNRKARSTPNIDT